MKSYSKHYKQLEWHQVDPCFAHIRIHTAKEQYPLLMSLQCYGQLVPVIVVPKANHTQWILIDGYRRMQALQQLGNDTIEAEIWDTAADQAWLSVFVGKQARPWHAIEEGLLLRELIDGGCWTQNKLANHMGKSKAWVSHRLQLIKNLPESAIKAVSEEHLSIWVAIRIIGPFARANSIHTQLLLEHLSTHHYSARTLQQFFERYQKSNHHCREEMINNLELFFKSQIFKNNEKQAKKLKSGPEGKWLTELQQITTQLKALVQQAPTVLYARQKQQERDRLLKPFNNLETQFNLLNTTIRSLANDR